MSEWENQFKIGTAGLGKGLRINKEHILNTSDSAPKIGAVRTKFLDWLDETIRIGDEMDSKLKEMDRLKKENSSLKKSLKNWHKESKWHEQRASELNQSINNMRLEKHEVMMDLEDIKEIVFDEKRSPSQIAEQLRLDLEGKE